MVGNPVICLDIFEKANFYHLSTIEADTAIVSLDLINSDLDLSLFPTLKQLYLIGDTQYKVDTAPDVQRFHFSGKNYKYFNI